MFSPQNKRRLVEKSENLNKYGPFFIIIPLPVMLKFTFHFTAVHLFTCVAKAATSRRSRELWYILTISYNAQKKLLFFSQYHIMHKKCCFMGFLGHSQPLQGGGGTYAPPGSATAFVQSPLLGAIS